MKRTIRLRESELKHMIAESMKRILNEADFSNFPYKGDFYERNRWWKNQMDTDMPNNGINNSDDFQRDYNKLQTDRLEQDRLNAKKAKEDERLRARSEKEDLKRQRMDAKKERRSLFVKAVEFTLYGDECLINSNSYADILGDEEWNDWSDGITKLPLCFIDTKGRVVSKIYGVGLNNVSYDRNSHDYICGYGVYWGDEDDQATDIAIGIDLVPNANIVETTILYCSNRAIHRGYSNKMINKYINGQIRKNMKLVTDRIAKWENYRFKGK